MSNGSFGGVYPDEGWAQPPALELLLNYTELMSTPVTERSRSHQIVVRSRTLI